jgi:hypothetical protein
MACCVKLASQQLTRPKETFVPGQETPQPATTAHAKEQLRTVAKLLHEAHRLDSKAQELLAELVEELGRTLDTLPSDELAHLSECAAQLVQVAKQSDERRTLKTALDRLEGALVRVDARFPAIAAIGRRLLQALADLGI